MSILNPFEHIFSEVSSSVNVEPGLRFASIDIGSNAVRLLFALVFENEKGQVDVHKINLIRMPIRLGDDSFVDGKISDEKKQTLIKTMKAYKELTEVYNPLGFMACATSAMREASNAPEIVKEIWDKTGIKIEVIEGKLEAEYIFSNHVAEKLPEDRAYLYIDVGGGSTELSVFANQERYKSASFNIGPVRILDGRPVDKEWDRMQKWVEAHTRLFSKLSAIGSGGNINKIYKMAEPKPGKQLTAKKMKEVVKTLEAHTVHDRVRVLGLKPDRADVILPASEIYLSIMKWADIKEIHVPQIGLADGIIHILYDKWKAENGE
ncbi:MAG: exopolyphosphatase [Bacteroidetes bacterium]|nr:exopolyphosphatase [Bacteroidota bacterium]